MFLAGGACDDRVPPPAQPAPQVLWLTAQGQSAAQGQRSDEDCGAGMV